VRGLTAAIPVALVAAAMYVGFFPPLAAQCLFAVGSYFLVRLMIEGRGLSRGEAYRRR
jgi:hypothetical protein